MSILEVNQLNKTYDYYEKELGLKNSIKNLFNRKKLFKVAVKDISFAIEEGEAVGFIGPNGAGKTTTLKMLSGILFPTSGTASVMGYIPWERKKDFKMKFSIVMGQKSQLWWDLPANESLYLAKNIYELDDKQYRQNLEELTELLDVKDLLKIQVRRLSLGERMKMELIAALLHMPKVIFLDEPTIGLDLISQKKIREFLNYYNQQKKATILLTSHYMNDIESICKRSIIINHGEIVYDGDLNKINQLFSKKKLLKIQFIEPVATEILKFGEVKKEDALNVIIEVDKDKLKEYSSFIINKLPVIDFNIEDIPIENGIELLYKQKEIVRMG